MPIVEYKHTTFGACQQFFAQNARSDIQLTIDLFQYKYQCQQQHQRLYASCQNWIAEPVSPESLTTTTTTTTTATTTTSTTTITTTTTTTTATTTTVTTTAQITTTPPLSPVNYGDANCDGIVSIADAAAIFQYIANPDKYPISSQGIKNADVNGKIGITSDDAICIQMLDAGLLPSLPVNANF